MSIFFIGGSLEKSVNVSQYGRRIFEIISGKCLDNITSHYLEDKNDNFFNALFFEGMCLLK